MALVKLKDVVMRVKDKVDRNTADLDFYIGGEHFDYAEICISRRGVIQGSTIGPAFHMRFQPGDVLLMSRNPHLRKAGVVDFEGICSDVSYVCRTKDENVLLQRYLPFIFQTDHFWDFAESNKKGSTNFFLNWSDFEKYEFNLPPIEIQRELTELLWAAENTKLAYVDLLRQTDELVKSQFIEMFGDPFINERGWKVSEFSKLCTAIGDGLHGTPVYDDEGPYPFINGNNLRENKIEITPETRRVGQEMYDKHFIDLDNTTVMLSINGTLGKTALYNGETVILGKSACYSKVGPLLDREFVLAVFLSDAFQQYMQDNSTGTTIKNFGLKALRTYPMIVPPIEEQRKYVQFMRQSDKSKFELKQAIERVTNLMKSLMQQDFAN